MIKREKQVVELHSIDLVSSGTCCAALPLDLKNAPEKQVEPPSD